VLLEASYVIRGKLCTWLGAGFSFICILSLYFLRSSHVSVLISCSLNFCFQTFFFCRNPVKNTIIHPSHPRARKIKNVLRPWKEMSLLKDGRNREGALRLAS